MSQDAPPIDAPATLRVLVIVEDPGLAELLDEALREAGHEPLVVRDVAPFECALREPPAFNVVIVDLDTHAWDGPALLRRASVAAVTATLIAFAPFGGLDLPVECDLVVEKPGRLSALFSALAATRPRSNN